jgi:hypothetical protein
MLRIDQFLAGGDEFLRSTGWPPAAVDRWRLLRVPSHVNETRIAENECRKRSAEVEFCEVVTSATVVVDIYFLLLPICKWKCIKKETP